MKVQDIMTREVESCRRSATLTQVVGRMKEAGCGFVPVLDDSGRVAGVVTDRDVSLALVRTTRKPINIPVVELMNAPVRTCGPTDDVRAVLQTMTRFKVRRLPVVAPDGALEGVISIDDIIIHAFGTQAPRAVEIVFALREIVKCERQPASPPGTES